MARDNPCVLTNIYPYVIGILCEACATTAFCCVLCSKKTCDLCDTLGIQAEHSICKRTSDFWLFRRKLYAL